MPRVHLYPPTRGKERVQGPKKKNVSEANNSKIFCAMSVDSLSDVDASALEETGALLGMPEIQNQRQTVSWPVSLPVTTKGWARMCFWLLQSLVTAFSAILAIWTIWVYFPSTLTLDTTETNLLAKTVNGTYAGLYHVKYDQVLFLGMPYARPPLGDLRLRPPKFLNQTWEGYRNATSYGPQCMGYKVSFSPSSLPSIKS